jgi:hypothetical protein
MHRAAEQRVSGGQQLQAGLGDVFGHLDFRQLGQAQACQHGSAPDVAVVDCDRAADGHQGFGATRNWRCAGGVRPRATRCRRGYVKTRQSWCARSCGCAGAPGR